MSVKVSVKMSVKVPVKMSDKVACSGRFTNSGSLLVCPAHAYFLGEAGGVVTLLVQIRASINTAVIRCNTRASVKRLYLPSSVRMYHK